MNIILIMIPLSLLLMAAAAVIFFWAVNHGQFDDMQSPGLLPMSDNLAEEKPEEKEPTEDTVTKQDNSKTDPDSHAADQTS